MYSPLLLVALCTWPTQAPTSRLVRFPLDCPVCEQGFTAVGCTDANDRGGTDRDLFVHAMGPQPVYYLVATCPHCGYSGYVGDFDRGTIVPPDLREKIIKEKRLALPEGFSPDSDPRELDASERYERAIACYIWSQRGDEALAWLHLRAGWVWRDKGAILPPDVRLARVMRFIQKWRPRIGPESNQAEAEMQLVTRMTEALAQGQFNRFQKPYVELVLALLLRGHGENVSAKAILKRLADPPDFAAPLTEGIERMAASIEAERAHQQKSAEHFERALLADEVSPHNRGPACYLLGELNRRLGRCGAAVTWYDKALAEPGLPAEIQAWARQQRTGCSGQ